MSPDPQLAARAADLLAELLTAERDTAPAALTDAVERVYAEIGSDEITTGLPLLGLTLLVLLTRVAAQGAQHWCEDDYGGDWAATVKAMRERMLS